MCDLTIQMTINYIYLIPTHSLHFPPFQQSRAQSTFHQEGNQSSKLLIPFWLQYLNHDDITSSFQKTDQSSLYAAARVARSTYIHQQIVGMKCGMQSLMTSSVKLLCQHSGTLECKWNRKLTGPKFLAGGLGMRLPFQIPGFWSFLVQHYK